MCNITHVKIINSSNFFLENNNYLFKILYLILNVQVLIQNFYFELLNVCKFAHDRKTHMTIITKHFKVKNYFN